MIRTDAIDSLTNFQKNAKAFVTKLEETNTPVILTVNGKAKVVIQNAEAYQVLLDELESARAVAAIREGIDESKAGLARPAEQVYAEMKSKYDL